MSISNNYFGINLEVDERVWPPSSYAGMFLDILANLDLEGKRVLDFGTGTGILAIACAKKGAEVVGSDISPYAISVARRNAILNDVSVDFREADRFEGMETLAGSFDLIVANTPSSPGSRVDVKVRMSAVEYNENGDGSELLRSVMVEGWRFVRNGGKLLSCVNAEQKISESFRILSEVWRNVEVIKSEEVEFNTQGLDAYREKWTREGYVYKRGEKYYHEVRFFVASK